MKLKEKIKQKSDDFQKELGGDKEIEDSLEFRLIVTITVLLGICSTFLIPQDSYITAICAIFLTISGTYISYNRRNKKNWWIKLILSLFMLVAFASFLREALINPYDPRVPLANLLIWLQVLHSYDLPRRKDLNYSLFVALILICVTATVSRDLYFGIFLIPFGIFALLSLLYNNLSKNKATKVKLDTTQVAKISYKPLIVTLFGMLFIFLFMPRFQTMKVKTFPMSIKIPEIPNFQGEIKNKNNKEVKKSTINGKEVLSIKRNFDKNAYYGFSTELDLNFRGELSDEIVMKIRSTEKNYIRGMAFDIYDGKQWKMSEPFKLRRIIADKPPLYTRMTYQNKRDFNPKRELIQTFYIEKEQSNLVFSVPYAEEIYFPSGYLMTDSYGGIRSPVELAEGTTYTVISSVPSITKESLLKDYNPTFVSKKYYNDDLFKGDNLEKALEETYKIKKHSKAYLERLRKSEDYIYSIDENYLKLPENISDRIYSLAEDITKDYKTQYEKVMIIQSFLQATFKYNLKIPEFPENAETVDYFLFKQKEGYCEHFATSMVVMLRSIGIPARLVTGFAPSTYNQITGYYEVKSSDAHAWVEVYFPKSSWVAFEPTPSYLVPESTGEKNKGNILGAYYISKLLDYLKQYIPPSVINSVKSFVENTLNFAISVFSYLAKIVFSIDIRTFFFMILFTVVIILIGVFFFAKNKNKKELLKKELELEKLFNSKLKIEIIKIQDNFIQEFSKVGFKYEKNLTLKEFSENIILKYPDLETNLIDFVDNIYYFRYRDNKITDNDINSCKNKLEKLLESLKLEKITN
ncbi:MAG: DUF3488 and transglutaminase-like domain-containing protein [Candidatus Sericytochromatia bacterium]